MSKFQPCDLPALGDVMAREMQLLMTPSGTGVRAKERVIRRVRTSSTKFTVLRASAEFDQALGHGPAVDDDDTTLFGIHCCKQRRDVFRDFLRL